MKSDVNRALQVYLCLYVVLLVFAAGYVLGNHFATETMPGEAGGVFVEINYSEDVPPVETHPTASQEAGE